MSKTVNKSKLSKFQKFEALTINRQEIQNAPYNPRKIGDNEQKKLRKSLKIHGLVETLVFNKRTGNLVGGHQRLSQLDVLEGTKDYELTVAVVDIDEKQEIELNISLNNPNLQGEYDFDILKSLFQEGKIDHEAAGYDEVDLSLFGIETDLEEIEEEAIEKNDIKDKIEHVKALKAESKENNISKGENYAVVTFGSIEEKESFMEYIGQEPDDRYIKGEYLAKKMGKVKKD